MRLLTICQPYAHLIALPEGAPHCKRVENRRWHCAYKGPLAIHAGKSRNWLELSDNGTCDEMYDIPLSDMVFGAVVCMADMVACLPIRGIRSLRFQDRFPWINDHEHTEGPFCFVLQNVRRLSEPLPMRGQQGLWSPTKEEQAEIERRLG